MTSNYAPDEVRAMRAALRAGRAAACPRCGSGLERTAVPPKGGVAYVRDRVWLVCPGCRRSLVLERRDVEEPRDGG